MLGHKITLALLDDADPRPEERALFSAFCKMDWVEPYFCPLKRCHAQVLREFRGIHTRRGFLDRLINLTGIFFIMGVFYQNFLDLWFEENNPKKGGEVAGQRGSLWVSPGFKGYGLLGLGFLGSGFRDLSSLGF